MRKHIFKVTCIIFLGSEASQALIVDIESQRIDWSDGNIDSEIKLKSVDEEGVSYILRHDHRQSTRYFIKVRNDRDSFALRGSFRLHNPERLVGLLFGQRSHILLQGLVLTRAIEREGHEVEVFHSVERLHSRKPLIHTVFSSQFIRPREMIYFLKAS